MHNIERNKKMEHYHAQESEIWSKTVCFLENFVRRVTSLKSITRPDAMFCRCACKNKSMYETYNLLENELTKPFNVVLAMVTVAIFTDNFSTVKRHRSA